MGFDFHFHSLADRADIYQLLDFLHMQDLGYKGYNEWIARSEHEFISGYKQAVVALSGKRVVGDVVTQPSKDCSQFLEIKNIRVHPEMRERYFSKFMLRQVEREARENKYAGIICDARADQYHEVNYMRLQGYRTVQKIALYERDKADIVMVKIFDSSNEPLLNVAHNIAVNKHALSLSI